MPKIKILVVDDDNFVRGFLRRCLRRLGYEVFEASEPSVAKEVMRHTKFTLVFTDLEMPNAAIGREFLDYLSNNFPEVKVVLCTSADISTVSEPYDFYLSKPFGFRELEESLRTIL